RARRWLRHSARRRSGGYWDCLRRDDLRGRLQDDGRREDVAAGGPAGQLPHGAGHRPGTTVEVVRRNRERTDLQDYGWRGDVDARLPQYRRGEFDRREPGLDRLHDDSLRCRLTELGRWRPLEPAEHRLPATVSLRNQCITLHRTLDSSDVQ